MELADATITRGNTPAYGDSLLDLLGDRDPWHVQESLVPALKTAIAGLSDADLRRPEKPGKWSVLQVIQHLADAEMTYGYRMRMILAHDTPEIQPYDQDLWADRLRYNDGDLDEALARLDVQRRATLRMLRGLSDEEWQRYGLHAERGPESIERLFRLLAGHDLLHLRQIDRIKKAHGLA